MAINFKYYIEKILSVLKVKTFVGGLEVSDLLIRLAHFDGKTWRLAGVRLEPGIIEGGKIKNRDGFVSALRALRSQVFKGRDLKGKTSVIVSLSSISIYSQVFSLPIIEGENMEKAIQLNVQMVSPMEASQAYSGWQTVGEDKDSLRLEILSAFVERTTIDELGQVLLDGGFVAVAVDSRALALARLFREEAAGFDIGKSYVLLSIDNSGMDFLVIRRGHLYFEYFSPWREITDDKGEMSTSAFNTAVTRNLHRLMNFYGQHWPEPLAGVVLSATALRDETTKIVTENFSLPVTELRLKMDQSMSPEWFVVLGCGLRGMKPRSADKEVSLLGIGAAEEFRREQAVVFAKFWRLLVPLTLGLLLASFILSDLFLAQTRNSLEARALPGILSERTKEYSVLAAQAEDFNRSVKFIKGVQDSSFSYGKLWDKISELMSAAGVTPNSFHLDNIDSSVSLSGVAASENQVAALKAALANDPQFANVNLPLSHIKTDVGGVSFSLTFTINH